MLRIIILNLYCCWKFFISLHFYFYMTTIYCGHKWVLALKRHHSRVKIKPVLELCPFSKLIFENMIVVRTFFISINFRLKNTIQCNVFIKWFLRYGADGRHLQELSSTVYIPQRWYADMAKNVQEDFFFPPFSRQGAGSALKLFLGKTTIFLEG